MSVDGIRGVQKPAVHGTDDRWLGVNERDEPWLEKDSSGLGEPLQSRESGWWPNKARYIRTQTYERGYQTWRGGMGLPRARAVSLQS